MNAGLIGLLTGVLIVLIPVCFKRLDKVFFYGLTLCAIGFLYVGFTWKDTTGLIINCQQAVFFLFLAYYGMKNGPLILAIGYFLHGCWDIAYGFLSTSNLIPPHYDIFCLVADFTIAGRLVWMNYKIPKAFTGV